MFTQKRTGDIGTLHRVPAQEVEAKVIEALRSVGPAHAEATDDKAILQMASRISIEKGNIVVTLADDAEVTIEDRNLCIPWSPRPTKAKRHIILPHTDPSKDQRPIQVEQRDRLLRAVAKGRLWLKELTAGQVASPEDIAAREGRSKRSVHMMLSLAFVAPDIVEAAVMGALPRGIGLTRLMDLPPLWSNQRETLGLKTRL